MQNIIIFVQAYLLGRIGSRLIGLMLILSLIWWAGPYLGLTGSHVRIYTIFGVLVVSALIWLAKILLVKRRSKKFRQDLDSHSTTQDHSRQAEIAELKTKMNDAITSLKSSELGVQNRGNAALYALPWFMIIGPSAAGKTTLLRNSGLNFPYAHDSDIDIRGFGGTRNCDWWFSNDAVLLDTAGRYTTEQDDHHEWLEFLALLRKHRRRQPLNGAIVAISISELLTADSKEIERHVKIIRDRIDELTTELACVFPIYIVFTKCDLLYGFSSFFADLDEQEREQVWGVWLGHHNTPDISNGFALGIDKLYLRLCELRINKISMVRKKELKSELFGFPNQFEAGKEILVDFIARLTKENPYQDTPNFCGIYLTSATQEGTPIQKIVGKMRQAFGYVDEDLPTALPEPVSFFVKNVFKQVVFPNSQDVSRSKKAGFINRTLKTACILCCAATVIVSFLVLSTSLTMNSLLLKNGTNAVQELSALVKSNEQNPRTRIAAFAAALTHYDKLISYQDKRPLQLVIGVYEGNKQLPYIKSVLLDAFEQLIFKPLYLDLEKSLSDKTHAWAASHVKDQDRMRDDYYRLLKTYLMLAKPEYLDGKYVDMTFQTLFSQRCHSFGLTESLSSQEQENVSKLLKLYLEQVKNSHTDLLFSADEQLITKAQKNLVNEPDAERIYAQLRNIGAEAHKDLALVDLLKGPDKGLITSQYHIPYIYTATGWYDYVTAQLEKTIKTACLGDWVTGYQQQKSTADEQVDAKLVSKISAEVRELYFKDYADTWLKVVENIRFKPFQDIKDSSDKLLVLAGLDGPIAELFQVIAENIELYEYRNESPLSATGTAPEQISALQGNSERKRIAELETALHDLRKFAIPGDKMSTRLLVNQYLLALGSAQSEFDQLAAAVDLSQESYDYTAMILSGDGASQSELYKSWLTTKSITNGIGARTRKAAENLFSQPLSLAWGTTLAEARSFLQNQWKTAVYANYKKKIAGKNPFKKGGSDASLADITDFFRDDDGLIWSYTNTQLKPFLRKRRTGWTNKTWLDQGVNISASFLNALPRAAEISEGLLRRGQPDVHYAIYPIPSSGLRVVSFNSNGQKMIYQNEPQEWKSFSWPGDISETSASISCIPIGDQAQTKLDFSGEWSLFHLLEEAQMTPENGQYLVTWTLPTEYHQDAVIRFKLRPDRHTNAFSRNLFSTFSLPEKIF